MTGLTTMCDEFLSKRKIKPLLIPLCLFKMRSTPRATRNVPVAVQAKSFQNLVQCLTLRWRNLNSVLTNPLLWYLTRAIQVPPNTPRTAIITQPNTYPTPDPSSPTGNNKPSRNNMRRTPKLRPPTIPSKTIPGNFPISKQPNKNPAAKKASESNVRIMSDIPVAPTVLTNDAHAKMANSANRGNQMVCCNSQAKVAARPMPTPVVIRHPLYPEKDSGTPTSKAKTIQITAGALRSLPLPSVAGP